MARTCSELQGTFCTKGPQFDPWRAYCPIAEYPPPWVSIFGHPEVTRLLQCYPGGRWATLRLQELQHLLHLERERHHGLVTHSRPSDTHNRNRFTTFRLATTRCSDSQWLQAKRAIYQSTTVMLGKFLCSEGRWDSSLFTCMTRKTHLIELPPWSPWKRWSSDPLPRAAIPHILDPRH